MARPIKQTIEHFPHRIDGGRDLFIIEQRFGNDGYACLFKIKELLGSHEGHAFSCKHPGDWHFLLATTRLDADRCEQIMALLATLGIIDEELWHKERTIWCQDLVNGLKESYRKRKQSLPAKPVITITGAETIASGAETPVFGAEMSAQQDFYRQKPPQEGISGAETPNHEQKESSPPTPPLKKDLGSKEHIYTPPTPPQEAAKRARGKRIKVNINYDLEIGKALGSFSPSHKQAIREWISVVASLNKSKTLSQRKYLTLLGELGDVLATTTPDIFQAAVCEATAREIGVLGYIKAIVKRQTAQPQRRTHRAPIKAEGPSPPAYEPGWYRSKDGWRRTGAPSSEPALTDEEFKKRRSEKDAAKEHESVIPFVRLLTGDLASPAGGKA